MTDHTKLKIAAEAVKQSYADLCEHGGDEFAEAWNTAEMAYDDAANPDVVLALIAENERLNADCSSMRGSLKTYSVNTKKLVRDGSKASRERDQAEQDYKDVVGTIELRDIEIATLRAQVAGLKTGYEAYERVNAELKAECEVLRKDADRAAYWKQRAKSAEGHLFSGDFRAAAMELHKYSRFESTPWPELTGSQHALITSAAGAVIATVNRLRDARRPKNRDETDAIIWCACGDGHAANSYGAGFMDANSGVCWSCDAAMGQGDRS